ncbi:MAG: anaerobic magnesium-protoporphyrin IX monomethyl ester cyclase, partial [Gammaproteobacteria bacterium]
MARVAFVVTTCHEFEGIKALSATLKQHGHTSDCFITSEEKDFEGAVRDWRPDVVGIYATTGQERWCYPLIERWRRDLGHLKVVMGGPHPSFETDVLRDEEHVDATIKGEAEFAMLDLVNAWEANNPIGDILNIGVMRDGIPFQNMIRPIVQDLDTLPFPDVDIFYRYPFLRNKRVLQ